MLADRQECLCYRGGVKRFAFWALLALAGQAAALRMIDAGRLLHYQHYRPDGWALALFAVQALVVGGALARRWGAVRAWLGRWFRPWQLVALAVFMVLPAAAPSRDRAFYATELLFAALVQLVNLGNVVLAAWAWPAGWNPRLPQGPRPRAAAAWVTGLAALLSWFVYQRHPHVPDEVVYLYHARYFAAGKLALPAPPAPEAIQVELMMYEPERWYSPVPPGWPAVLALGVLLGAPWLVNPVLAGCNTLLAGRLLGRLYDAETARGALLLLCVSPWHLYMAMNFMTHTLALTCALVAALGVAQARESGRAAWGWLAGAATGMASLVRPLEGLALGACLGLWAAGAGGRRLPFKALAGFAVGAGLVGGAVLPYNRHLTGDPGLFPIMAYNDKYYGAKSNDLGFGPERGMGWQLDPYPGHGLRDALVNTALNASSVNIELFGWSTGSLLFAAALLFSGRFQGADRLMVGAMGAVFVVHIFYWFSGGPDFGARYWFLMLAPLTALTARGIQRLGGGRPALVLCLLSVLNYFPWRAVDKYYHYLNMRPDLRERDFGRSLVLVRGARHPDYASAAAYNPLDFGSGATVFAWDRNEEARRQARRAFSDRPVWLVDGPTVTGDGFRVVAGPLRDEPR